MKRKISNHNRFVIISVFFVIVILIVVVLWYLLKKQTKNNIHLSLLGSAFAPNYCDLAKVFLDNLQTQLSNAFVPENLVGPIQLILGDKIISIPKLEAFTQPVNIKDLPEYLTSSPIVSLINSKSIWDSIYLSDLNNSTDPFRLYLNTPQVLWINKTGEPICANSWVDLSSFELTDFTINNFASSLTVVSPQPTDCTPISKTSIRLTWPIQFETDPKIVAKILSHFKVYTGNCNYGPKCNNPFKSCFYDWVCYHDINQPCPNDRIKIYDQHSDGHIILSSHVILRNNIHFDIIADEKNTVEITNISIESTGFSITTDVDLDLDLLPPAGKSIFQWIEKDKIQKHIQSLVSDVLKKLVPELYTELNKSLEDVKIYYHF